MVQMGADKTLVIDFSLWAVVHIFKEMMLY